MYFGLYYSFKYVKLCVPTSSIRGQMNSSNCWLSCQIATPYCTPILISQHVIKP